MHTQIAEEASPLSFNWLVNEDSGRKSLGDDAAVMLSDRLLTALTAGGKGVSAT